MRPIRSADESATHTRGNAQRLFTPMKSRLLLMAALGTCLAWPAHAPATVALSEFADSAGCRLRGSAESIARLREIAAEGSVTWVGRCAGGYIDGPGVLRHEGLTRTNDRARRYVFYLTGTAKAGVRAGTWWRETFNMFEDSSRYWTSRATITYVDGIAKGSPKLREVRSNADFTPAFRTFLAATDRRLAAAQEKPAPAPVAPPAATPAQPAPAATAAMGAVPAPPAERPDAAQPAAPAADNAPLRRPPGTEPGPAPGLPIAAARPALAAAAASPKAPAAPAASAQRVNPPASAFQGSGLRPLEGTGTPLAAAPTRQEIVEQNAACFVDEINGRIIRQESIVAFAGQPLKISGWAADPRQPRIPELAWLRIFDRGGGPGLLLDLPRNVNRPDVASALGNALYARAGFEVNIEAGRLAPGEYTVAIVQQLDGMMAVCTATGRLSLMAGDARAAPSPR
jgi:hypothetical protein